jgi:hypothetical protein
MTYKLWIEEVRLINGEHSGSGDLLWPDIESLEENTSYSGIAYVSTLEKRSERVFIDACYHMVEGMGPRWRLRCNATLPSSRFLISSEEGIGVTYDGTALIREAVGRFAHVLQGRDSLAPWGMCFGDVPGVLSRPSGVRDWRQCSVALFGSMPPPTGVLQVSGLDGEFFGAVEIGHGAD